MHKELSNRKVLFLHKIKTPSQKTTFYHKTPKNPTAYQSVHLCYYIPKNVSPNEAPHRNYKGGHK